MTLSKQAKNLRARRFGAVVFAGATWATMTIAAPSHAADDEVQTEVVITEKARAHFGAGVNFMQDPDGARYVEAYREFQAAYAESPSWKILGNLGISAMKLERDGEAIEAFETYLRDSGDHLDEAERSQVQRDLDTLKAGVVWVEITSVPPGATLTDQRTPLAGSPVVNRYGPLDGTLVIGLHPGRHTITVELAGYEPSTWTFDARSGSERVSKSFELVKIEEKSEPTPGAVPVAPPSAQAGPAERPIPMGVWIGAGVTGALAIGAGVAGVLALDKKSQFDLVNADIDDETDAADAKELRESGQTLNLVTDVLIGGAVVAAGVTTYLFFTRPEVTPEQDTALTVAPVALPGGGGIFAHGSF